MSAARASGQTLRLLMLSHYFEVHRGGIEVVAAALAHGLTSHGFNLVWLATGASEGSVEPAYRRGSLAASSAAEKLLKIPYPLLWPSAWRTIFREVRRSDIVMVHDALYMTSIVACLAAHALGKPFVVVQHVGFVPYRSTFLRQLMRIANCCVAMPLLRRADRVVFISELPRRYFASVRWRREPALVFNGVDTDIFRPAATGAEVDSIRRDLALPRGVRVALFVGRFTEKKGLRILELLAAARTDICFAFAGQGSLDPTRWGLANVRVYTSLTGAELASLYRASDLLVLPSVGEGFPLVVQEAMACGLPIVCGSDTAQADPRAALFLAGVDVDLENPAHTARLFSEEITRVLARPAADAERRERFEFARANYSWSTSCAIYADLLRSLCMRAR